MDTIVIPPELSLRSFARLANFITAELGIKMPESKLTMLQSRLLRRVRELGLNSLEQYGEYFFSPGHAGEREQLINAITTNKTDFFREPGHFEFLTRVVIPSLRHVRQQRSPRLKVWSAGCSSGEEPYTLAMLLNEYALAHSGFDFAILGTDISTKMLEKARTGIYQQPRIAPVPPELRTKYLWRSRNHSEGLVRLVPELRRKVTFHRLNLMDEDYRIKDRFEIVFFRNVMIYFDRAIQQAVVNKICRNLTSDAYFFVGHSESLAGFDVPLKMVRTSIYRRA